MVSLVMPAWKPREDWLREAVDSALGQNGCDVELIVVDDGSPEPVADLLQGVDDERLEVIEIPHGGISRARNAGIARARGDLIRFIDADDVLEPDSTARLVELSGPERRLAYGSTLVCDPQLRPQRLIEETSQGDVLLASVLGGFYVYITAMVFPREVIAAAGDFDPQMEPNEDFEFLLRALEHGPVRGERFVATKYRRHERSITANSGPANMKDMEAVERLLQRRPDLVGSEFERRARSHLTLNAARQLLHAGAYLPSLKMIFRSLRLAPRYALPEMPSFLAELSRLGIRRVLRR
jgi:glycosyltransferase involved in cell wall biosynthesis